jgi:hypothetical protein
MGRRPIDTDSLGAELGVLVLYFLRRTFQSDLGFEADEYVEFLSSAAFESSAEVGAVVRLSVGFCAPEKTAAFAVPRLPLDCLFLLQRFKVPAGTEKAVDSDRGNLFCDGDRLQSVNVQSPDCWRTTNPRLHSFTNYGFPL